MGKFDKFLGEFRDADLTKIQKDKLKQVMPGFLGCYVTYAQFVAKYPTGSAGEYAYINATGTYWDWDTTTNAWVDTGSAISSYTKAEVDALLALKQFITDNSLTTTSKTVPGAINELKDGKQDKASLESDVAGFGFIQKNTAGSEARIWNEKGGLIELFGTDGKIVAAKLPSFVDDVIEVNQYEDLPQPGETGKIYVVLTGVYANRCYRWSGSIYVEISPSLVIGTVAGTAFDGSRGLAVETGLSSHVANTNNPHAVTKAQIGLGNVDNTSDQDKPISTAAQTALDEKIAYADVINSLDSTETKMPLSANMGKTLQDEKQPITDNTLTTTSKTVPGSINELNSGKLSREDVPVRENSTNYTADARVSYPGKYGYMLKCTTGGQSGASLPVWPTSITSGSTTLTDGGVLWTIFDFTAVSDVSGKLDRTELPVRVNEHAYAAGDRVLYPEKYSYVLICKTGGQSGASVPSWPGTIESGTTELGDGTVTWKVYDLTRGDGNYLLQKSVYPTVYDPTFKVFQYVGSEPGYDFGAIYVENSTLSGYELLYKPMTELEATGATETETRIISPAVLGKAIDEKFYGYLKLRKSSTAYAIGDRVQYPGKTAFLLKCIQAGSSAASVPTWPASVVTEETTLTDGTVIWQIVDAGDCLAKKQAALREYSKSYALGDRVLYPGKPSWSLICTTAGESGTTLPVWPTSIISGTTTLSDGTMVWTIFDMAISNDQTERLVSRANSNAYALGDRVFYPGSRVYWMLCIQAGQTASSKPALPASIVSGVTELVDGNAKWILFDIKQSVPELSTFPTTITDDSPAAFLYVGTETGKVQYAMYGRGSVYMATGAGCTGYCGTLPTAGNTVPLYTTPALTTVDPDLELSTGDGTTFEIADAEQGIQVTATISTVSGGGYERLKWGSGDAVPVTSVMPPTDTELLDKIVMYTGSDTTSYKRGGHYYHRTATPDYVEVHAENLTTGEDYTFYTAQPLPAVQITPNPTKAYLDKELTQDSGYWADQLNVYSDPTQIIGVMAVDTYTNHSGVTEGWVPADGVTYHHNADTSAHSALLANYEVLTNKVTSISSTSTDTQYPSAKLLYDQLAAKAATATTLAGYGITDAYTQTAANNKFQLLSNKVTSISSSSTDTQYPSAKCVYNNFVLKGKTDLAWTELTKASAVTAGAIWCCCRNSIVYIIGNDLTTSTQSAIFHLAVIPSDYRSPGVVYGMGFGEYGTTLASMVWTDSSGCLYVHPTFGGITDNKGRIFMSYPLF